MNPDPTPSRAALLQRPRRMAESREEGVNAFSSAVALPPFACTSTVPLRFLSRTPARWTKPCGSRPFARGPSPPSAEDGGKSLGTRERRQIRRAPRSCKSGLRRSGPGAGGRRPALPGRRSGSPPPRAASPEAPCGMACEGARRGWRLPGRTIHAIPSPSRPFTVHARLPRAIGRSPSCRAGAPAGSPGRRGDATPPSHVLTASAR